MKNTMLVLLFTTVTISSMMQANRYYDENGYEHRGFLENVFELPVEAPAAVVGEGHWANPAYDPYYDTRRDQSRENKANCRHQ